MGEDIWDKDYPMPRAPRQCAKPGCRNTHPCWRPGHASGWASKDPTISPLPPDWAWIKKNVPKTGCVWDVDREIDAGHIPYPEDSPYNLCGTWSNLELDHIVPRFAGGGDSFANLQWLCPRHHRAKGRLDKKRYPRERGSRP